MFVEILGKLFSFTLVTIIFFWIIARVRGRTFWEQYNDLFDSITGEQSNPINLSGLSGRRIGRKQPPKIRKIRPINSNQKKNLKKLFGGKNE